MSSLENTLIDKGDGDYELSSGAVSCWIQVDGLSVYVSRGIGRQNTVTVEVYDVGRETDSPLAELTATASDKFDEGEEDGD